MHGLKTRCKNNHETPKFLRLACQVRLAMMRAVIGFGIQAIFQISLIALPRTQRIRPRAAFSAGFFIPLNFTGSEPLEPLALI